ncbi:YigZ family protein [Porticoccus sp. W117]|uniref:YigZ family protein n=1 Tax=Porticoccus sp. W117 TaxID=3054777 RepID=UPI0025961147|nr:YigZ family protein [Porticoccus sp. W117]MDM3871220.1 YigZ family protein [Porticoccus sp. W117]
MTEFVTPADRAECTYEIKKSRFIAVAAPASSREQAMAFLQQVRDQYPDARHHCWAYLLGKSPSTLSAAMSDDGEPSGTAGKPILNVLQHKGVGNVMVVVVRYFGGIKLGAGGLVRAYSTATQQVMEILPVQQQREMAAATLECDFSREQSVRHWLQQHNGVLENVAYGKNVVMAIGVPSERMPALLAFAAANNCLITEDKPPQ